MPLAAANYPTENRNENECEGSTIEPVVQMRMSSEYPIRISYRSGDDHRGTHSISQRQILPAPMSSPHSRSPWWTWPQRGQVESICLRVTSRHGLETEGEWSSVQVKVVPLRAVSRVAASDGDLRDNASLPICGVRASSSVLPCEPGLDTGDASTSAESAESKRTGRNRSKHRSCCLPFRARLDSRTQHQRPCPLFPRRMSAAAERSPSA